MLDALNSDQTPIHRNKSKFRETPEVEFLIQQIQEAPSDPELHQAVAKLHQKLNDMNGSYPPDNRGEVQSSIIKILYWWLVFFASSQVLVYLKSYSEGTLNWVVVLAATFVFVLLAGICYRLISVCQSIIQPDDDPFDSSHTYRRS